MDDLLTLSAVMRARSALDVAAQTALGTSSAKKAAAFTEMAVAIAKATDQQTAVAALQRMSSLHIQKAAAHSTLAEVWGDSDAQALARNFIASTAEPDLLGAISKYARVIDRAAGRVLIASGATGDTTTEGFPKLIRRLDLSVGADLAFTKSTAAVVVSAELLSATGDAGRKLFEGELARAVVRATNTAVVASLLDSNTTQIAAGADPLASLRAGLAAAGPADGFVVAAPPGQVAWLATSEANRGAGIRGGTFVPGVELVAVDDLTTMVVIPASRLAYWDGGIELRPAGHATVDMSDAPGTTGEKVSLWQTNAVGLLCERFWRLAGDTTAVRVG